jgi:hypothetical protein
VSGALLLPSQAGSSSILPVVEPSGDTSGATDLAIINAALSSRSQVVLGPGSFYINGDLALHSYNSLKGYGVGVTFINQVSAAHNGLSGTDLQNVTLQDFGLSGPGSGTGHGITITLSANNSLPYLNFARLDIASFGGRGLSLQSPQSSVFESIVSLLNGSHGFYFYSSTATTSCTFNSCYAIQNGAYGYYIQSMVYSQFNACAADKNVSGGYYFLDPQGMGMAGCGCEALTGTGLTIDGTGGGGGYGMVVDGFWLYNNNNIGIHITGGAKGITIISAVENTPGLTTVAAGSNGGEISAIASWTSPSAGVLDVASTAYFNPTGGTVTVATSTTTATITYTGVATGQLTGCAYVSGSATGTVATGGAVQAPVDFILEDAGCAVVLINPQNVTANTLNGNYVVTDQNAQLSISGPGGTFLGTTGVYGILTAHAGIDTAPSAPVLTPAISNSGTQLSDTTRDYMVYLQVGTAGTAFSVTMGASSSASDVTIVNSAVATAGEIVGFRMPAGWYAKYAITTGTIAHQAAVGC